MKPYRFVGLDKDVWIPDDIYVVKDIVPTSRTNVRSRQAFTGQNKTTWHDTGNSGSTADSERNWLHANMPKSYSAGYNFACDGVPRTIDGKSYRGKIIQLTPLNEVTWAAGTPEGNRMSYHTEQCFGGPNVWTNSLYVTAALHGGIIAAKGWTTNSALVQHNVWYGKNCPGQIRARGIWGDVVKMVDSARNLAIVAAKGETPTEQKPVVYPVYLDGRLWDGSANVTVNNVAFIADKKTVTTVNGIVNTRTFASSQSAPTGSLTAQSQINVLGWCRGEKVGDEDRWWITDGWSRVWVGGTVDKPTEAPTPEEPQPETDGSYRVVNGNVYYPVSNEIRHIVTEQETKVYRWASLSAPVLATLPAETELNVAYWCIGDVINQEVIWWVLVDEEGRDPIQYGGRVHATNALDRPE